MEYNSDDEGSDNEEKTDQSLQEEESYDVRQSVDTTGRDPQMLCAIMEKSKSMRGTGNVETAGKKGSGYQSRIFSLHNGVLSYYSHTIIKKPLVMKRCRCELRQRKAYKRSDTGKSTNTPETLVLLQIIL